MSFADKGGFDGLDLDYEHEMQEGSERESTTEANGVHATALSPKSGHPKDILAGRLWFFFLECHAHHGGSSLSYT